MHTPRAFRSDDLQALDQLAAQAPLATLITPGQSWLPQISHLPVGYQRDDQQIQFEGHWSRANPQALPSGPAMLILHGPHSYVSPGWYPDKLPAHRVPTWNYVVAHLHGQLHAVTEEQELAALIARLSASFEASIGGDWQFETDDPHQHRQLRGLIGFRFEVSRFELTLKLSQNHPDANIDAVIARLCELPGSSAIATAQWMQHWRPRQPSS
jgi:transcriptional regulator